MKNKKKNKLFVGLFMLWISIFAIGLVRKTLQNDTFYTIKIGELILNNGIDMMDHFSYHVGLPYTYPHWLYDVFIYIVFKSFGYPGLYVSSIVLLIILLLIVFRTNILTCNKNYFMAALATFICALSISGFATARAQLVSFIVFALTIYFIESFLKNGCKLYLFGLLLLSLILCNIHVAVWPFYYILYLPYFAEYIICFIAQKIKLKRESKFINFLKSRIVLEKNERVKYLFFTFLLSLFTGLLTPIGDTPYTYLIKTMMGNSQKYIQEHQMITWANSPFTIIIAAETIFFAIFSKIKLRDLFMIIGLSFMSVMSVRHISLLALVGTICFGRVFSLFFDNNKLDINDKVISFFTKRSIIVVAFTLVITFTFFMTKHQLKSDYIDKELYPVSAVKYIKNNIDIEKMHIFNDYDFGSYLLLNNIPVFIDSRADLYTKQFSGFDYDIFDDYEYIYNNYQEKFQFYDITHVLIYKNNNNLYNILKNDYNYEKLYEDDVFVLYEKLKKPKFIVTFEN